MSPVLKPLSQRRNPKPTRRSGPPRLGRCATGAALPARTPRLLDDRGEEGIGTASPSWGRCPDSGCARHSLLMSLLTLVGSWAPQTLNLPRQRFCQGADLTLEFVETQSSPSLEF